jgi:hypothetical protein
MSAPSSSHASTASCSTSNRTGCTGILILDNSRQKYRCMQRMSFFLSNKMRIPPAERFEFLPAYSGFVSVFEQPQTISHGYCHRGILMSGIGHPNRGAFFRQPNYVLYRAAFSKTILRNNSGPKRPLDTATNQVKFLLLFSTSRVDL